jgi:hypothetical protein
MILMRLATDGEGAGEDGLEFLSFSRLFRHWHDLHFTAVNAQGDVLAATNTRLVDQVEGDALLAAILSAADRQGVMVVESIGQQTATPVHLWYGGRPLLAPASLATADRIFTQLQGHGCTVAQDEVSTQLHFESPPRAKPQLVIQLISLVVGFPLLLSVSYRRALRSAWHELRGRGQPVWSLRVQADEVVSRHEQGDVVYQQQRVAGHRILGFAWSLVLSYGNKAEISGPHLRVALVDGFATLDVPKELAPDVRDLLTRASLDWRARHPELGLPHGDAPATRCPYCGALYIFTPGAGCPSCGGWPDQVG